MRNGDGRPRGEGGAVRPSPPPPGKASIESVDTYIGELGALRMQVDREKADYVHEKFDLEKKLAIATSKLNSQEALGKSLTRRVRMLEFALRQERSSFVRTLRLRTQPFSLLNLDSEGETRNAGAFALASELTQNAIEASPGNEGGGSSSSSSSSSHTQAVGGQEGGKNPAVVGGWRGEVKHLSSLSTECGRLLKEFLGYHTDFEQCLGSLGEVYENRVRFLLQQQQQKASVEGGGKDDKERGGNDTASRPLSVWAGSEGGEGKDKIKSGGEGGTPSKGEGEDSADQEQVGEEERERERMERIPASAAVADIQAMPSPLGPQPHSHSDSETRGEAVLETICFRGGCCELGLEEDEIPPRLLMRASVAHLNKQMLSLAEYLDFLFYPPQQDEKIRHLASAAHKLTVLAEAAVSTRLILACQSLFTDASPEDAELEKGQGDLPVAAGMGVGVPVAVEGEGKGGGKTAASSPSPEGLKEGKGGEKENGEDSSAGGEEETTTGAPLPSETVEGGDDSSSSASAAGTIEKDAEVLENGKGKGGGGESIGVREEDKESEENDEEDENEEIDEDSEVGITECVQRLVESSEKILNVFRLWHIADTKASLVGKSASEMSIDALRGQVGKQAWEEGKGAGGERVRGRWRIPRGRGVCVASGIENENVDRPLSAEEGENGFAGNSIEKSKGAGQQEEEEEYGTDDEDDDPAFDSQSPEMFLKALGLQHAKFALPNPKSEEGEGKKTLKDEAADDPDAKEDRPKSSDSVPHLSPTNKPLKEGEEPKETKEKEKEVASVLGIEAREQVLQVRSVLRGHLDGVRAIECDAEGPTHCLVSGLLFSASEDGLIRGWDLRSVGQPGGMANGAAVTREKLPEDGEAFIAFRGHRGAVLSLSFANVHRLLFSGGQDNLIRLWRVPYPSEYDHLGPSNGQHGGDLRTAAFSGHQDSVWSLHVHPGVPVLASASADGTVRLWSLRLPLLGIGNGNDPAALVSNAFALAKASTSNQNAEAEIGAFARGGGCPVVSPLVHCLDFTDTGINKGNQALKPGAAGWGVPTGVRWLPSDLNAAVVGLRSGHTHIVDMELTKPIRTFDAPSAPSSLGGVQPSGGTNGAGDGTMATTTLPERLAGMGFAPNAVTSVTPHHTLPLVFTSHTDGVARLWDLRTRWQVGDFCGHNDAVTAALLDREGLTLATASHDGHLRCFDIRTGSLLQNFVVHRARKYGERIHCMGLSSPRGEDMQCILSVGGANGDITLVDGILPRKATLTCASLPVDPLL
uniref:Striatin N-terminal domain-containing protein n=1 Tax=Chromera velia CCMP2878 TaxID=1169474 RepID=A0A0G4FYD3_9ALVE|eukprot:Cvel_19355.t1-p1 / transcript=Cvel_19355.t1 / gene=Cvel_19355 / organism=Chromera_velia_CCMP2878 / gene_product=Striatin-4, putative / transcript_product=Striatin-4, putative / location=Cvel_scaffold1662:26275-36683(-) / protein_length=1263 / sequence_SO=supercontig / SO=protein_coding / is_pseudo=false